MVINRLSKVEVILCVLICKTLSCWLLSSKAFRCWSSSTGNPLSITSDVSRDRWPKNGSSESMHFEQVHERGEFARVVLIRAVEICAQHT